MSRDLSSRDGDVSPPDHMPLRKVQPHTAVESLTLPAVTTARRRSRPSQAGRTSVVSPRTRQRRCCPLPCHIRRLTSTRHAINDQSARARAPTRGPSRTGSAGMRSGTSDARTACRSGSSPRRLPPPEGGAPAYASPLRPESPRSLPTVPRPARCERRAAASRRLAAAFSSLVPAPAQNHGPLSGRQGNQTRARRSPLGGHLSGRPQTRATSGARPRRVGRGRRARLAGPFGVTPLQRREPPRAGPPR